MLRNNYVGEQAESENNSQQQAGTAPFQEASQPHMRTPDIQKISDGMEAGKFGLQEASNNITSSLSSKPIRADRYNAKQQQLGLQPSNTQTSGYMDIDQLGPDLMMAPSLPYHQTIDKSVRLSDQNETEMLRLIQQYLVQHGYNQVAHELELASSVRMEQCQVTQFRDAVLAGNFDDIPEIVATLIRAADAGRNNKNEIMLQKREFVEQEQTRMIEYLLFEQKYMELLEKGKVMEAIQVLQTDLQSRAPIKERLHELAQLLMIDQRRINLDDMQPESKGLETKLYDQTIPMLHNEKEVANGITLNGNTGSQNQGSQQLKKKSILQQCAPWWKGSGVEGRACLLEKVQQIFQQEEMLQPNRLEILLKQALSYQLQNCRFHNQHMNSFSLLTDHHCTADVIPQKCIATITKHKDQVWLVQFSAFGGDQLATVCKDGTIFIWKLRWVPESMVQTVDIRCHVQIATKHNNICSINWSNTSDKYIVTAGKDKFAMVWGAETGKSVLKLEGHSNCIQTAIFSKDDKKVFTIGIDQILIIWEVELENENQLTGPKAKVLSRIKTKYYEDMALQSNRLVSVNKSRIYCYDFTSAEGRGEALFEEEEEMTDMAGQICDEESIDESYDEMLIEQSDYDDAQGPHVKELELNDIVTAVCLSKDGKQLLANTSMTKPRIEMWDIETKDCIRKFKGHEQKNYILRPAFGGLDERLVVCGSEDTNIYIWNKLSGELIARLLGHYQIVNSVAWAPCSAYLFASASDDMTLKCALNCILR